MFGESVEDALTAEKLDAPNAEADEKLDERELLEEVEAMDKEDAIPPGGFWQRLDTECETIGVGEGCSDRATLEQ